MKKKFSQVLLYLRYSVQTVVYKRLPSSCLDFVRTTSHLSGSYRPWNKFLLWASYLSNLDKENLISRRCNRCHYCSSSECSSFRSCLSLPPSTVAFTLPIVSPLRGSGTSLLASFGVASDDTLEVCFNES